MNANRLGPNIDIHGVDRVNFAFTQHSNNPRSGFFRIM